MSKCIYSELEGGSGVKARSKSESESGPEPVVIVKRSEVLSEAQKGWPKLIES